MPSTDRATTHHNRAPTARTTKTTLGRRRQSRRQLPVGRGPLESTIMQPSNRIHATKSTPARIPSTSAAMPVFPYKEWASATAAPTMRTPSMIEARPPRTVIIMMRCSSRFRFQIDRSLGVGDLRDSCVVEGSLSGAMGRLRAQPGFTVMRRTLQPECRPVRYRLSVPPVSDLPAGPARWPYLSWAARIPAANPSSNPSSKPASRPCRYASHGGRRQSWSWQREARSGASPARGACLLPSWSGRCRVGTCHALPGQWRVGAALLR